MKKLKWVSLEEAFKKDFKNPVFKKAYEAEMARLRIATDIKRLRAAKKMTQRQVAAKAAMPQSVIARIESGRHPISLNTLSRIAAVFKKQVGFVE